MGFVWWEKTVEYAFVMCAARKHGDTFMAPLSGIEESAAGDLILANDSRLVLIEFKRRFRELSSEMDKFRDFDEACCALDEMDSHHFLVWGDSNGSSLDLYARTYFSSKQKCDPLDVLDCGAEKEIFDAYLAQLLEHKVPDGRSGESSGSRDIGMVMIVHADGRPAGCISGLEYARCTQLDCAVVQTSKPSGPGLGP